MAIVTDPDLATRQEIIYGTDLQELSIYPVGALTDATATGSDGVTVNASKTFTSATALFTTTNAVSPGDVLCIFTGQEAGHYVVDTVDSATQLTLLQAVNFSPGDTAQVYEVRDPTGGALTDGISEQALYSFTKEEWHTDGENYGGDDLIRHEMPWEMITPDQAEIGGGIPHADWEFFARGNVIDYTHKKIRDGGWETKDNISVRVDMFSGLVSLGDIESAAQPYYQQTDTLADPENFRFTGKVNEAVLVHDGGAGDYTTYLKAFLRHKYFGYDSYDVLVKLNLSTIFNKKYSFPLSHKSDSGITAWDAEIEGNTPFSNFTSVTNDTDGITTIATGTFTNTGATDFAAAGVVAGDVLYLSSGTDAGYYTITNVATTTITVEINNADFTTFAGDTAITFVVHTKNILTGIIDGVLADVDGATGTFSSVTGGFTAAGIVANDLVIITEAASDHRGIYKVITNDSDTQLTLDTSDRIFTTQTAIDADIVEPGMYMEYKEEAITIVTPGNITLADGNPDTITRASGSWITDGVSVGSVITIAGASNAANNKSYTVASLVALELTLIATDSLIAEGPSALTVTAYDAFKRTIDSVVYAFHWRMFGQDTTLAKQYEWTQKALRETIDIDMGSAVFRGDITDSFFTFTTPSGLTEDMYIDDLNAADANSVTYVDATGVSRIEKFVAAGSLDFDPNLVADIAPAKFWMFYENDDAGDNLGNDYGTPNAIIVKDNSGTDINGDVTGDSVSFDFDYDNNDQRGVGAKGTDAPVVVVALGLATAQFVLKKYTLTRDKANNITVSAALERNYST